MPRLPTPLPVPATPVGGGRMGECGVIVPAGAPPLPSDISAGSWMIADLDTGEILAAKDPHGRYRPASTLKLLTAQVMLKNLTNLDLPVEGTQADTAQDGTRVGLEAGGVYTVRQLLSYLVMISGNDAANALARTNGGYDKTVADMNATALALGALDTRAATPSGLDGPGQSTSAYDLALFARKDMATPPFPEMISAQDVRVPGAGNEGYIAANDNQLLYQYPGALGGKTGFTDDAGNTYVGMAERNGRRLVVTMMNGNHVPRRQWMQAASLLDWGFALPATTPPVGQLVGSLAEATGAPSPTPSTGPPTASGASGATGSAGTGAADTAVSSGEAAPTADDSAHHRWAADRGDRAGRDRRARRHPGGGPAGPAPVPEQARGLRRGREPADRAEEPASDGRGRRRERRHDETARTRRRDATPRRARGRSAATARGDAGRERRQPRSPSHPTGALPHRMSRPRTLRPPTRARHPRRTSHPTGGTTGNPPASAPPA